MKVFLDTNVLVSGFATRGLCADVIRLVLAEHEFITADVVLNELKRVLKRKIQLPGEQSQEILTFLESQTVQPKAKSLSSIPSRDEDDQWNLYECDARSHIRGSVLTPAACVVSR